MVLSNNSNEGTSERCAQADISDNNEAIQQILTPFSGSLQAPPNLATADSISPSLKCPVSTCSLVFTGRASQGYLQNHLKNPEICGHEEDKKVAWINLHIIEHDRLAETGGVFPLSPNLHPSCRWGGVKPANKFCIVMPSKPKLGVKEQEEQRVSRTASFRLRAERMGITDAAWVGEKLAIWEGMWVDKEEGNSIGVSILCFIP
ncbi:hypothetical protein HOY82DRAFT_536670 [Tuber indicum]|nr:hypothetical protein HOY82DRAFT_536670 [Tuber indicum]